MPVRSGTHFVQQVVHDGKDFILLDRVESRLDVHLDKVQSWPDISDVPIAPRPGGDVWGWEQDVHSVVDVDQLLLERIDRSKDLISPEKR